LGRKDASGGIMVSYIDGQLCHDFIPFSIQKTRGKMRVDISVVVEPDCRSWAPRVAVPRNPRKIRKIVLGTSDVSTGRIAEELESFYDERARQLVAFRLQLNGSKQVGWINPKISETVEKMRQAREYASKTNTSARKFWQKLEMLYSFDVGGLPFHSLQNEIGNFQKPFEF
jgi:hypothetical protein